MMAAVLSLLTFGCMTMAFLLIDELVQDRIEVPIVNPAKVSIKVAEMLVSLGLKQSRASYPKPNIEKLRGSLFPKMKNS